MVETVIEVLVLNDQLRSDAQARLLALLLYTELV